MKSGELLDAIGNIKSETAERNKLVIDDDANREEAVREKASVHDAKRRWRSVGSILAAAAALLVIVTGGLGYYRTALHKGAATEASDDVGPAADTTYAVAENFSDAAMEEEEEAEAEAAGEAVEELCDTVKDQDMGLPMAGESGMQGASPESAKENSIDWGPYVSVNEMIPVERNVTEILYTAQVEIGLYTAQYECIPEAVEDVIKNSVGVAVEGNEGWYRVSGHEELRFLIHVSDGKYSLWKFGHFMSDEYPFSDVLHMIYCINSADDMGIVVVYAANMDNTEEGRKLQEEIGVNYIANTFDLQALYDILCGMTCYGGDRWDLIDYGASDEGMLQAVRMGRYLNIFRNIVRGGSDDDMADGGFRLNYTAVSGMFYEYGGVAYNRLTEQDKATVDRILGIEAGED